MSLKYLLIISACSPNITIHYNCSRPLYSTLKSSSRRVKPQSRKLENQRFCHVPNGALEKFGPADEQKDGAEHDLRLCSSNDTEPYALSLKP